MKGIRVTDRVAGQLVLIGGGGHAKVVADCARSCGWTIAGFYDDAPADSPFPLADSGVPFLGPVPTEFGRPGNDEAQPTALFIAIGDNEDRKRLAGSVWAADGPSPDARPGHVKVVHASSVVSPSAHIGSGTLVAPGAVINADARIESDCIINSSAVVEHDCIVGAAAHLAPGSVLGGAVAVGSLSLVGLGARVLPGVRIGSRCTVGAGAVVTANVPDGATVTGIPAKPVTSR
ncbi:MAG: acetyltransferase [Planctomycetes bacterium]|nr:acetyltransferase [Planctomycetota bacterium]